MTAPARAALYMAGGSTLTTCARHAERAGLRVVTMINEDRPGVGLAGARLNGLVDRLGDREFEVIVADAGAGRVVTIAAVPQDDGPQDDVPAAAPVPAPSPAHRCAIYLRCASASRATPYPLADQWNACEAYAAERGWETVTVYKDNAVSGMTGSRPSLDAMIAEAGRGAFDVVLVEDVSRLSRDASQVLRLLAELKTLGVAVHTVVGGVVTDLDVAFRSVMTESLRQERSLRARYGHAEAKRRKVMS